MMNWRTPLTSIGQGLTDVVVYIGEITVFARENVRVLFKDKIEWHEVIRQCHLLGIRSAPIACLILFFVGLVFAIQFGTTLAPLGATPYIGRMVSLSLTRELGPVFTALVVGGRIGAGMTAEIGSMKVTEQIDAIRALGANPNRKVFLPRIIAATVTMPIVSFMATVVGILGGMLIASMQFGLPVSHYYKTSIDSVYLTDFIQGYIKPYFFGFWIAVASCYAGLNCEAGTEGVGRATTKTVVVISVITCIIDFILTQIFTALPRM